MTDALIPRPDLVARFEADLKPLVGKKAKLGIAVSGGPDSLALLLLAAASRKDRIEAATVDHRLRPESEGEAEFVRSVCQQLGVPHVTLPVKVAAGSSIQAADGGETVECRRLRCMRTDNYPTRS